ncbi:hypothetical protein [Terriglobus tenax]|nr:hypothetical protein [Terriglobus tenax]
MNMMNAMMDILLGCSLVAVVVIPCLVASRFGKAQAHTNKTA